MSTALARRVDALAGVNVRGCPTCGVGRGRVEIRVRTHASTPGPEVCPTCGFRLVYKVKVPGLDTVPRGQRELLTPEELREYTLEAAPV